MDREVVTISGEGIGEIFYSLAGGRVGRGLKPGGNKKYVHKSGKNTVGQMLFYLVEISKNSNKYSSLNSISYSFKDSIYSCFKVCFLWCTFWFKIYFTTRSIWEML